MGRRLSCLLGFAAAALATSGVEAAVIVDLGTAGRATRFVDTSCGKAGASAIQFGTGITPASDGGCKRDGPVLSENFTIPEGAFDITLTIAAFSSTGDASLLVDGDRFEAGETCDDGDCEREFGRHGGADRHDRGAVIDDLRAGGTYAIDIRFFGFGNDDDRDERSRRATASLSATLTYTLPSVANLVPRSQALPPPGPAPAIPEPASGILLPATLALLALRRRGLRSLFKRRR